MTLNELLEKYDRNLIRRISTEKLEQVMEKLSTASEEDLSHSEYVLGCYAALELAIAEMYKEMVQFFRLLCADEKEIEGWTTLLKERLATFLNQAERIGIEEGRMSRIHNKESVARILELHNRSQES